MCNEKGGYFCAMKITIDIRKTSVMGIVEGLTVILSQHNGGSPSFEQLWASPGEQKKLDIYYREAVNDLELRLSKWLAKSSGQFDLQQAGDDYHLSLTLTDRWNSRLYGLLCNKIQDYLVHYILHGWLSGFEQVEAPGYLEQAQQDALDIERVLLEQDLSFDAFARGSGNDSAKDVSEGGTPTSERQSANDATKDLSDGSTATSERQSASDATKDLSDGSTATSERQSVHDSTKVGGSDAPVAGERNTDNSRVLIHHERMNMSGRLTPRDMCMRPPRKVMEPYDDSNLRRWIIYLQNSVNALRVIIEGGAVIDERYVHTDNNYTNEEKSKLRGLHNYDDSALRALISGKQDIIEDLAAIRSGAAKGNTAYQKPWDGISYADLAADVIMHIQHGVAGFEKTSLLEALIPVAASANNKLADVNFVNSSIETNTATFRGTYNLVSQLSLTVSATQAQIAAVLNTTVQVKDNNDYVFVLIPTADATPTEISRVDRYKYNGSTFAYEWSLNNSSFTAAQWAALNSGITSGLVEKLNLLPTSVQLNSLLNGKVDAVQGKGLSTNDYTNEEKNKLAGLSNYNDAALRALIGDKQDKTSVVPVVFPASGSAAPEEDEIVILSPNTIVEATFVDYMAFAFDSPYNNEKCEYCLKFDVGNSVPSLDLGEEISWAEALTLEANKHYVIVVTYECGALYGDWKSYPVIEQQEEEEEA